MSDRADEAIARSGGTPRRASEFIALIASLGALVGIASGAGEIVAHGYLELGFRRLAFVLLRTSATESTLCFAVVATLAAALLLAVRRVTDRVDRFAASAPSSATSRALLFAALFATALALATVWPKRGPLLAIENEITLVALTVVVALGFATVRALLLAQGQHRSLGVAGSALIGAPLAAVLGIWASSPWLAAPTLEVANPKNVILIGIDTIRIDRTSLVERPDPERALTPHLRALAERGISFDTAVPQAPWTMPSFASVLTGEYPRVHGAISLAGLLPKRVTTLAELLYEAGYETRGVVTQLYVDREHGFAQGFESYNEDHKVGHEGRTSEAVTDLALDLLRARSERPLFLFLHYFDPHWLYEDRQGFDYTQYEGWLRSEQYEMANIRRNRNLLDAADIGFLRDLYDEEISATDQSIGRILDWIAAEGLEDEFAIVVVGDHGEEFLERGWLGHTTSMHPEVLKVPLVMRLPGWDPVPNAGTPVETRAVFWSILDYLGLDDWSSPMAASLLPVWIQELAGIVSDETPVFSSSLLADAPVNSGKRVVLESVQHRGWKLIRDETRDRTHLYDLSVDPWERNDVAHEEPERLRELEEQRRLWTEAMGTAAEIETRELDPEDIERLEALGYL